MYELLAKVFCITESKFLFVAVDVITFWKSKIVEHFRKQVPAKMANHFSHCAIVTCKLTITVKRYSNLNVTNELQHIHERLLKICCIKILSNRRIKVNLYPTQDKHKIGFIEHFIHCAQKCMHFNCLILQNKRKNQ